MLVQLKKTPQSILVNERWVYVNDHLHSGDQLCITLDEQDNASAILPVALPLDIVFEDDDILVLNKPANMPIHPSLGNYENTLANSVMHYFSAQDCPYTFRCVNRLDRDTTGLTLLAKHMLSSGILSRQQATKQIQRTYLAIAGGRTDEQGTICAPIARAAESTIERIVDFEQGEHAVTHYWRLAYRDGLSLLRVQLETGRTHQIRVHMKHIGHPLIGDFLYNPDFSQIKRQALHSWRLDFIHPISKEPVSYSAPLPDDMARLFKGDFL